MGTLRLSLVAILVLSLLLGLVPAALAAPPEFDTVEFDFTFPIDGCSFPVEGRLTATAKISVHTDQNDDFKMEIDRTLQGAQFTYTNLDTGTSLTTISAGPNIIRVEKDGSITITPIGLFGIVTLPGQGLVVQDVGRFTIDDETGEIIFEAGKYTVHGPGGNMEAFCAALE